MNRVDTSLPGVYELRPKVFQDARGFFLETYRRDQFVALGLGDTFVQDNQSSSVKGTLRGLHYQLQHPQAKLCRVVQGEAVDVAVDIRAGSPNFGRWASVALSATTQNQIYIPAGFAHGFLALSDHVQLVYKCSDYYYSEDECGVAWNDPALGIAWGIAAPLLSAKDAKLPNLRDIPPARLPVFIAQ